MDSGGGGSTTTVQKSDPWSGVQPYLLGGGTVTRLNPGTAPMYSMPTTPGMPRIGAPRAMEGGMGEGGDNSGDSATGGYGVGDSQATGGMGLGNNFGGGGSGVTSNQMAQALGTGLSLMGAGPIGLAVGLGNWASNKFGGTPNDPTGNGGTGNGGNNGSFSSISPQLMSLLNSGNISLNTNSQPYTSPILQGLKNPGADFSTVSGPGIFPEAQSLYVNGGWTPAMQSYTDQYGEQISGAMKPVLDNTYQFAHDLLYGGNDPNVQRVGPISGPNGINAPVISGPNAVNSPMISGPQSVRAATADPGQALSYFGSANPTGALSSLLSGSPSNPWLKQQLQGNTAAVNQNYGDLVQQAQQALLPAVGQNAEAGGQYGGSRQGIAEGLIGQQLARNARDLSENLAGTNAGILGSAYQNAQNLQGSTANNLASLGTGVAQTNAGLNQQAQTTNAGNQLATQTTNAGLNQQGQIVNAGNQLATQQFNAGNNMTAQQQNAQNQLATQTFNANLGLQNNAQAMQDAPILFNNRANAIGLLSSAPNLYTQQYQALMNGQQAPNNYNWQNLNRYASIVSPGAGMGSQVQQSTPYFTNPTANLLGLGLGGLSLYNGLTQAGLLGGGAAAASPSAYEAMAGLLA